MCIASWAPCGPSGVSMRLKILHAMRPRCSYDRDMTSSTRTQDTKCHPCCFHVVFKVHCGGMRHREAFIIVHQPLLTVRRECVVCPRKLRQKPQMRLGSLAGKLGKSPLSTRIPTSNIDKDAKDSHDTMTARPDCPRASWWLLLPPVIRQRSCHISGLAFPRVCTNARLDQLSLFMLVTLITKRVGVALETGKRELGRIGSMLFYYSATVPFTSPSKALCRAKNNRMITRCM